MATAHREHQEPANAGAIGVKVFFRIADRWGLSSKEAETLLGVPRNTYYRWRKAPEAAQPSRDTLERISYVLGIYKALHILFPIAQVADEWPIRMTDHPFFHHGRPLDRMLGGNVADLYEVRRFLDGLRGGWQ